MRNKILSYALSVLLVLVPYVGYAAGPRNSGYGTCNTCYETKIVKDHYINQIVFAPVFAPDGYYTVGNEYMLKNTVAAVLQELQTGKVTYDQPVATVSDPAWNKLPYAGQPIQGAVWANPRTLTAVPMYVCPAPMPTPTPTPGPAPNDITLANKAQLDQIASSNVKAYLKLAGPTALDGIPEPYKSDVAFRKLVELGEAPAYLEKPKTPAKPAAPEAGTFKAIPPAAASVKPAQPAEQTTGASEDLQRQVLGIFMKVSDPVGGQKACVQCHGLTDQLSGNTRLVNHIGENLSLAKLSSGKKTALIDVVTKKLMPPSVLEDKSKPKLSHAVSDADIEILKSWVKFD